MKEHVKISGNVPQRKPHSKMSIDQLKEKAEKQAGVRKTPLENLKEIYNKIIT